MCDLSDPRIVNAYTEIIQGEPTNWLLLGYNDTRDVISLYNKGTNGLSEFRKQLKEEILYGFVRVDDRFILITWQSEQVSGVRRARALVHGRSVAALLKEHHAQITASSINDLSDANIRTRLKLGENQVPNRSRPPSLSERKRSSLNSRRQSGSPGPESFSPEPGTFVEPPEELPSAGGEDTEKIKQAARERASAALEQKQQQLAEAKAREEAQRAQAKQRAEAEAERAQTLARAKAQAQAQAEAQARAVAQAQAEGRTLTPAKTPTSIPANAITQEKVVAQLASQAKVRTDPKAIIEFRAKAYAEKQAAKAAQEEQERAAMQQRLKEAEKTKDALLIGYASVQSSKNPYWRRRYFILRGKQLAFYRDETARLPVAVIDLKTVTRLSAIDEETETFVPNAFVFETQKDGTFQMFADNKKECSTIFTALQTVIRSK